MKLIVIGDIHHKYEKAERIVQKYTKDHKIIFVGDYFDDFGDTPEMSIATAEWLKYSIQQPNRIHLKGNHDEIYDPRTSCMCSGFSTQKKTAINTVLTIEDWDKLKYFHFENKWWFSHAGFTEYWFQHPMKGTIELEHVETVIDRAIQSQRIGDGNNALWASDRARGGSSPVGGLLWCDWRNLPLIPNMRQIVGHTPIAHINAITDNLINSTIVNVDCSSQTRLGEVLEIEEDGSRNILITSYL